MSLRVGHVYHVTEIEHRQPVRDRKTKKLRPSKLPPKIKSRRLAIITDGAYEIGGRISNFWNWTYFQEDGTLGTETGNGYNNGHPFLFKEASEYTTTVKLVKKKKK